MIEGTGVHFVRLDLDADAVVLLGREEMIDHIEALLARRPIDAADVDECT